MKILVALENFSENSRMVLQSLQDGLSKDSTEIKIITIIEPFESETGATVAESIRRKRRGDAEKLLEAAQEFLETETDFEVTTEWLEAFKIHKVIVDAAKEWHADLIVLGSHSKSSLQRLLLGSSSHSVLLKAPCSVRVVKSQDINITDSLNVLIAVDGSAYSELVFKSVLSRSWPSDTNFKILTVIEPALEYLVSDNPIEVLGEIADNLSVKERLRSYLVAKKLEVCRSLQSSNVEIELLEGDPREAILKKADKWQASLIFMGTKGRTGLENLLLGSVSQAVASYSKCSVEIVR